MFTGKVRCSNLLWSTLKKYLFIAGFFCFVKNVSRETFKFLINW